MAQLLEKNSFLSIASFASDFLHCHIMFFQHSATVTEETSTSISGIEGTCAKDVSPTFLHYRVLIHSNKWLIQGFKVGQERLWMGGWYTDIVEKVKSYFIFFPYTRYDLDIHFLTQCSWLEWIFLSIWWPLQIWAKHCSDVSYKPVAGSSLGYKLEPSGFGLAQIKRDKCGTTTCTGEGRTKALKARLSCPDLDAWLLYSKRHLESWRNITKC